MYRCPYCNVVSHSAEDTKRRYCGACHKFGGATYYTDELHPDALAAAMEIVRNEYDNIDQLVALVADHIAEHSVEIGEVCPNWCVPAPVALFFDDIAPVRVARIGLLCLRRLGEIEYERTKPT